ncbi:hypothetical protein [Sphingobium sp.]|uniref:hypothetical protein n=1 Tax=Sphingobium sp. TaxID=1912891 RepID=UPI0028BD6CE2|nr:hypothetical protein [Sphingobium sp.]
MTDLVANIRARLAPLLTEVEGALDRREKQYPTLIANGRMEDHVAAKEIRIWRAIVADWRVTVTTMGMKGEGTTIEEKIEVLNDTIGRYNAALAKEIRGSSDAVRRDCVEGASLASLSDRHGEAVAPILDIHRRRERIEDIRDFYRQALPGSPGLFRGIDDYLDFHQQIRAGRQRKEAA